MQLQNGIGALIITFLAWLYFAYFIPWLTEHSNSEIINSEMTPSMEKYVVETAKVAFEKYSDNREAAIYVREMLDEKYGVFWNCIIGDSASSVSHVKGIAVVFELARVR